MQMGTEIPRNGGEFSRYIEKLKGQYLEKKHEAENQLSKEAQEKMAKRRQLFDTMTISARDKERMKREMCRLEAKRIQCDLEGKNNEEHILLSRIEQKKAIFRQKYGK